MKKIKQKQNNSDFFTIKRKRRSLSFVKGTPVLPVVSKADIPDIIELLEELREEDEMFGDMEEREQN